jgi:A/G-specific adenine glycosylase
MLQQTRVAAVIPYYRRFLRRFPTVHALAHARSEQVLRQWAGLGYYSRARNLHCAAKEILRRHNGRFPRERKRAQALPGVGQYTAAAVLSIAYNQPLAVLDGNVARVLVRLGAVRGNLRTPKRWRELSQCAQRLLAPNHPGEWNQATMELGATICTPRAPRCRECPVAHWCRAQALGIAEQLPAKRKKPTVAVEIAAAVLLDRKSRTLLLRPEHSPANGFFARLWQFPAVRVRRSARAELHRHLSALAPALRVGGPSCFEPLPAIRHAVTRHAITLRPFLVRLRSLPRMEHTAIVPLARAEALGVSNATRKIVAAALAHLKSAN